MKRIGSFGLRACAALAALMGVVGFGSAFGEVLYWRGTSNAKASDAANWVNGNGEATHAPAGGEDIFLDADSADNPMTWDLDVSVGSWTQTADYTGTVTFQTGISRDKQTAHGVLDADGVTRVLKVTGDVTLNGGKWTHTRNPDTVTATDGKGVYRLIIDVGGNFTVGVNATVDVSALGFNIYRGPAASTGNCGGGHGGYGGFGNSGTLAVSDSIREPVMIGGAGTYSWYSGSAFILKAAMTTTIDGTIAANGQDSATWYGPAGGSVFISTGSFAGGATAVISADGGGAPNGKGGGGRISVLLSGEQSDFEDYKGVIRAAARKEPSGSNPGTGGTIYLETAADGVNRGTLIVDGLRMDDPKFTSVPAHDVKNATLITGDNLNCRPKKLILRNRAVVGVKSGDTWDLTETEIESDVTAGYANTIRLLGGTVVLPEQAFDNFSFASRVTGSNIRMKSDGTGVLKLGSGSTATFDRPLSIAGSLEILSGGKITHTAHAATDDSQSYSIDLTVSGDVTVRAGGTISARGKGYSANKGPGKAKQGSANRGASHGGIASKETGDICYGSPTRPTAIGSGGMSNTGGGAVKLTVAGTLTNDGSIDADGPSGSYHVGSGGSVWLTAARMFGSGAVTATGGHVTSYNTGGGGGRVALWLTDPTADFTNLDQTKVNLYSSVEVR